ncbi:hypothetical protein NDI43_27465 [Microcoleus vaginatus GB2-A3]|uniref:hypothetical protein n=1 Tax=Microcoleus vaginatus TaxID=119532 RepID=UPI0032A3A29B
MSASEPETPKPDNAVAQEVYNDLDNLTAENKKLREELAEARGPQHHLYTKIKELEERNRLLNIKSREERQKLEERLKNLDYSFECQGRRLAETQARLDELESVTEPEQQPAPAIDLSDKAWDVYSVVKPWLVSKAPKDLRSNIEKKLKEG